MTELLVSVIDFMTYYDEPKNIDFRRLVWVTQLKYIHPLPNKWMSNTVTLLGSLGRFYNIGFALL